MARKCINFIIILSLGFTLLNYAGGKWYNNYDDGLKSMKNGNWAVAIEHFRDAIKVKPKDVTKIKTYGMHFIEYFPHREMGICFYQLGQTELARKQLSISLNQTYSARAQEYLSKLSGPPQPLPRNTQQIQPPVQDTQPKIPPAKLDVVKEEPTPVAPTVQRPPVKLVGERMGIAVLPFQTKGLGSEMGEINIVEQMMTTFYNLNRFKLFERTQLEKILEEQKLGQTGVLDASTAAEIGQGIGVDAIVLGSVTRAGRNIAIDARLIDTETAQIITAQDEISARTSIQDLKEMISRLSTKIYQDLPLLEGYVIEVQGDQLTLDVGTDKGIKKGMKCNVYREGAEIVHPITKKVLGKQTEELGQVKLTQVFAQYSVGKVIKNNTGQFEIGNKFVTK